MALLRIVLVFMLSVILCSCGTNEYNKYTKDTKKEIIRLFDTKLVFPNDLLMVFQDSIRPFSQTELFYTPLKIVTIISGDCLNCVQSINDWSRITGEFENNTKVKVFVIVLSDSIEHFIDSYYSKVTIDYPLLIDQNFFMLVNNDLPERLELRTFLLNENNNIILVGNPLIGSTVETLYKNTIKEYTLPYQYLDN